MTRTNTNRVHINDDKVTNTYSILQSTHYVVQAYSLESRAGLAGDCFDVDGREVSRTNTGGSAAGAAEATGVTEVTGATGAAAGAGTGAGLVSACVIHLRAIITTLQYYMQTCY